MNWFDWAKEHLARWQSQEAASREFANKTFTPRALQVFALAHKEAERLHHNCVGTEHVLLGLIKLGNDVAVNILMKLGLDLAKVRAEVEKQAGLGSGKNPPLFIPFTPRLKKTLETAKKEAKALGHKYVGTEHLLLGLLGEREGLAARVFQQFKVDIEKTRKEILEEITPVFHPENIGPEKQSQ